MKQLLIAFCLVAMMVTSACVKGLDYTFDEYKIVELEDAVRLTPSAGVSYPVVAVTRTSGTRLVQVNLVGAKLPANQEMSFSIDTAITNQLNATTGRAVEGTDFDLKGGKFTFKQDSSFAFINFDIKNVPAQAGKFAFLLLKLDGNAEIKPSENYRRIGFKIDLK